MSKISVSELEKLFQFIITKLKEDQINSIELKTGFYKIITADQWECFDPRQLADIVVTGDLQDDLEEVKAFLHDPDKMFTYVDFDRISSILRAISQELNPPE